MSMTRSLVALAAMALIAGTMSTDTFAQSKRTAVAAARDVHQLIRMMDKDMNGTVSKDEFMQFMSQTFDRLDVNRSGELEHQELHRLPTRGGIPMFPVPGGT